MNSTKFVLAATALSSVMAASAAGAADLPSQYKSLPPPYAYLWTGFYVGANVGGGWFNANDGFGNNLNASGLVGGGQFGYNFQTGRWVWGAEADISGANASTNLGGANFNVDMVSTFTGRFGYALDRWLVYGKAGVGWVDVSVSVPGFSASGTGTGGAFGVGAEYAFANNWSAKLEYNIIDLGNDNVSFGNAFGSTTFQTLKAGINYRFGSFGSGFGHY